MKSPGSGGPQATHRRAARDPERAQTGRHLELPGGVKVRVNRAGFIDRLDTGVAHLEVEDFGPGWTRSSWPPRPYGSPALPSHALGPASAFGLAPRGRRGEPWRGELRLCHHGHHHNDQQHVLSSECCEPDTSHTGVSFLISSPYF
jgi:hypothetical protein